MPNLVESSVWDSSGIIADITGASEVSTTSVWNGVDDGSVDYPGVVDGLAAAWENPGRLIVAVDGPVQQRLFLEKMSVTVKGLAGLRTELECTGAASVLDQMILLPEPDAAVVDQSKDKQVITGEVVSTLSQIIRDTAARTGVPVVVAAGSASSGKKVSLTAEYQSLGKAIREAAESCGVAINARIWLPGDPIPEGVSVPTGGVIVTIDEPRDRSWVSWQDSDLPDGAVTLTEASASAGIVGYPGGVDGKTTKYKVVRDQVGTRQLGPWSGLEVMLDKSETDADADVQAAHQLSQSRASTSASATAPEGGPFYAGVDYALGDWVGLSIADVTARAVVTRVEQTVTFGIPALTASIGEPVLPAEVAVLAALMKRKV